MADENELMLELSIGGIFRNRNQNRNVTESTEKDINVQSDGGVNQVLRRRRKREEKVGSCGSVSGPFVENKELETEIGGAHKKEKIINVPENVDGDVNCVLRPPAFASFGQHIPMNAGGGRCCKMKSDGCVSAAYSDGQCSSHQGGTTDDSRSNSSNSQPDQQPATTSTSIKPSDQPASSSKKPISTTILTDPTVKPNDGSNPSESSVSTPPSKPEPGNQQQQASLLTRMPCVSTTGNGPNGKTVSGFLYRYTKKEVSIVCVCHGRSFSPAGFVEHAGGVDIAHPLKHITIFPAAFAS